MSFLADLLTDVTRNTLIISASSIRNKTILIVFGVLTFAVSTGLLFYFRSLPPTAIENYYGTEISYSRVYYDRNTDNRKIVLVSEGRNYNISYTIWQKQYSPETIINELTKSNRAKVWLDSPDSSQIKGIVSSTFSIDPSIGITWDKENRNAGIYLSWAFIGLGIILIVVTIFFM